MTQQQNQSLTETGITASPSLSHQYMEAYVAKAHKLRGQAVRDWFSRIPNSIRSLTIDFRQLFGLVPPHAN